MSETPRYAMPLLDAAQAQKHVTVNEALSRADALGAGRVERRDLATPPAGATDGAAYIVAAGAGGDWAGREGELALFLNGGWEFVAPWEGASFWVAAERLRVTRDGGTWVGGHLGGVPSGAATLGRVIEEEIVLSGAASSTGPMIPDKAIVLGVSARVVENVGGVTSWKLGVFGAEDRYGSGYGTANGSFAQGVTGQPQAYYGGTPLVLTATGGSFTEGRVRLAVHLLEILPPAA